MSYKIKLDALNTNTKNMVVEEEIRNVEQRLSNQQNRLLGSTAKVLRLQKEADCMCGIVSEKAKNIEMKEERVHSQEKNITVLENDLAKLLVRVEEREERLVNVRNQHKLLKLSLVQVSDEMTELQERITKKKEQVKQRKLRKLLMKENT